MADLSTRDLPTPTKAKLSPPARAQRERALRLAEQGWGLMLAGPF